MNRNLMILFMVLLVGLLFQTGQAQITIPNSGDVPSPGTVFNTWRIVSIDSTIFNRFTADAGGPQDWSLTGSSFTLQIPGIVVNKSGSPLADSFPDANLVVLTVDTQVPPDSIWAFSQQIPASVMTFGSVSHIPAAGETILKYQSVTPEYVFPMSLNSEWVSTYFYTQTYTGGVSIEYYDSTFNNVDAWGTITYQTKTVPCLRISYTSRFTSKTFVGGTLSTTTVTTEEGAQFYGEGFTFLFNLSKDIGSGEYFGFAGDDLVGSPTGVRENNPGMVPKGYELDQNYPNPFNPSTDIQFSLPRNSTVHLSVYNILGQEIKTLINQQMDAGIYTVDWDGTDDSNRQVASGIYFYRLTAGDFTQARKMVLVK